MKKTLLVILALVIALTLIMGSVSTVSAAPPQRLSITDVTLQPGSLHFHYSWDQLNAYSYFIVVYSPGPRYPYQQEYILEGRTPSYSDSLTVTDGITSGSNYTIYFYTYNKNGRMNGSTSYYAGQLSP